MLFRITLAIWLTLPRAVPMRIAVVGAHSELGQALVYRSARSRHATTAIMHPRDHGLFSNLPNSTIAHQSIVDAINNPPTVDAVLVDAGVVSAAGVSAIKRAFPAHVNVLCIDSPEATREACRLLDDLPAF